MYTHNVLIRFLAYLQLTAAKCSSKAADLTGKRRRYSRRKRRRD